MRSGVNDAVEDERLDAVGSHREMQRLDLHDRVGGGFGQGGSLHRLEPPGLTHLGIARTQVTHHKRRRYRVVALAPHRCADRDHLVDDGFCRVRAA